MISVRVASPLLLPANAEHLDRILPLLKAVAPVAAFVKQRVQQQQVVGKRPQYATGNKGYSVMLSYAWASGVQTKSTWWRSSYAFHAAAGSKPGQGVNSRHNRGMWQGYQVRSYGNNAVTVDFAGSSVGASSRRKGKEFADRKTGAMKMQRRNERVQNRLKAYSMWKAWGLNVTQMRDDEVGSLQAAVGYQARKAVADAFGLTVRPVWYAAGNVELYQQIVANWVK